MASTSASKAFPGFSKVYELAERSDITFRGVLSSDEDDDDCARVLRAEKTPPAPVEVRYAMGRNKPSDFIFTTNAYPLIISDRVLGLLEGEGFTGWRTYPIRLYGKDGARIPGYHGLAVHGRCGPIDDSKSVKLDTVYPAGIFPRWYGLYFDPATWDGSDLFMTASAMATIFVVEAVKRAFEKAKLTNIGFKPVAQARRPDLDLKEP